MKVCHRHSECIVVYEKGPCPVCEIVRDNFLMRTKLLTGASLPDLDLCKLPKLIKERYLEILKANKK